MVNYSASIFNAKPFKAKEQYNSSLLYPHGDVQLSINSIRKLGSESMPEGLIIDDVTLTG